ncbi:PAS domain S-box protein [Reichenbachiella carrageenanivorans]|uniref:histidine kinase n=1 Tax=Reichenbachiella carrageenanivorans TaxID=2979869 RepID=A0ABY6D042_9BACT|nr:PAS domain S-box protein [Reichenbachiella carrageenanivorans]UXX78423.1 PAS domain S-box protein [Reichenbachiella carrageenanivorans]
MVRTTTKHKTLLQLSRSDYLHNGRFKELVHEVLTALTYELDVERAGFWIFNQENGLVKNPFLYEKMSDSFVKGSCFDERDCPKFYDTIRSKLVIKIDDAGNSKLTEEIRSTYIKPNAIKSLLGIQVWYKEVILGVIFVECTTEVKSWTTHDKIYLTTAASYISQSYSSQLRIKEKGLRQLTEANYHSVFNDSPVPMLIYEPETYKILDANNGALLLYGYSLGEFTEMTLKELRAGHGKVSKSYDLDYEQKLNAKGETSEWEHRHRNGNTFTVQISGHATTYRDSKARIAVAIDVTKDKKQREEKEAVIAKLEDYAFYASHNIRRPISSILGIVDLVKMTWDDRDSYEELMANLRIATMDLDEVIRVMHAKLELD